jgi:alkylation response protein AidB-like acyl-CoA dehydrogenase
MDFDFSKDQYMARDAARQFLGERLPSTRLRQIVATDSGFDPALWRGLVELGWTSVLVPEEHGGLGLGFLDLALLLEESGRALVPAPVVETAVMLPIALGFAEPVPRGRWLPRIASGEAIGTVALGGREGLPLPGGLGVRARRDGSAFVLDGEALPVAFGAIADVVLVAARTNGGSHDVALFLVERGAPGLAWEPFAGLDATTRLGVMKLAGVRVPVEGLIGQPGTAWPVIERMLTAARTALALQAVGGAGRALEMAVEYAKVRQQFGKPIGTFQAIKHRCAEMLVGYETTRSGAWYAAWAVGTGAPDAAVASAMAKALATEAFRSITAEAIQVHGGIGFTWEHDLHFYFKRAKYLEFALGTPAECREAVAAARFCGARSGSGA